MRPFFPVAAEGESVTFLHRDLLQIPTGRRTIIDVAYSLKIMARPLLLFFGSHLIYGWLP